jgi:hypothetical protein
LTNKESLICVLSSHLEIGRALITTATHSHILAATDLHEAVHTTAVLQFNCSKMAEIVYKNRESDSSASSSLRQYVYEFKNVGLLST